MENLCTGCLSTGRKLTFIGDTGYYHLYSQIMNEIPVYDQSVVCVRVCWECQARLRSMQLFKQQAMRSLTDLMVASSSPAEQFSLLSTSNLSCQLQHNLSYPDIKYEYEIEVKNESAEHCEPEPFASALNVEQDVGTEQNNVKPLKKKKKTKDLRLLKKKNLKSSNKIKVKKKAKKRTNDNPLDNNKNQSDSAEDIEDNSFEESHIEESHIEESRIEKKKKTRNNLKSSNKIKVKKKAKKRANDNPIDNIKNSSDSAEDIEDNNFEESHIEESHIEESRIEKRHIEVNQTEERLIKEDIEESNAKKETKVPNGESLAQSTSVVKRKRSSEVLPDRPQCLECGKVFSSKKTYRYHINVLHKGQNQYPCPRCGKVYQWKSNLGRHMRSHRAVDDGELYCILCDKSFASVATFRQHLRISRKHVPEADFSFSCDDCGKRFVNKTRLRDHVDWEHLNKIKFRCQLCDKPFKCHTSLYVHTQNVHVGKEKKDNLCHVCGKSYQNAAKLKYHITAMHSGETPYRCVQCAAAFGWYSSLYRHMREVHYKMKAVGKKSKKLKIARDELPQYAPL